MYRRGEMKSMLEGIRDKHDDPAKADVEIEKKLTSELKSKAISIADFDFNQLASELVTDGRSLKDFALNFGSHDAGARGLVEAMGASAFPILTKTVVGFATIDSYEVEVGDVVRMVTEYTSKSTSKDVIPGSITAGEFELREEHGRYEEKHIGEKKTECYMDDFGETLSFTREALYEDRAGNLPVWARESGEKGGQHRAKIIIQTLEVLPRTVRNETTSTLKCHVANGTIITITNHYNSDHSSVTGLDGQTNDNADATDNSEITTAGVNACVTLLANMTDFKSDEIVTTPKMIIVPPALRMQAWQLLSSPGQFDTGNRAENFFKNVFPEGMIVTPFLTNAYYYYIGDPRRQLAWLWTFKPSVEMAVSTAEEVLMNRVIWRIVFSYHGGCAHRDYVRVVRGGAA